ncbi:hypothetical protein PoB_002059700 [Plakobranchus ocellatus]|uniref:Uncharacterized protein n=1 Tax=Plakobranchus ocellatus TaxID=259542 RepID=A0AAV3ZHV5_9GAST|nr:hypothetical protein PoB_002059700 [Plakobranchus ocellatus]
MLWRSSAGGVKMVRLRVNIMQILFYGVKMVRLRGDVQVLYCWTQDGQAQGRCAGPLLLDSRWSGSEKMCRSSFVGLKMARLREDVQVLFCWTQDGQAQERRAGPLLLDSRWSGSGGCRAGGVKIVRVREFLKSH